MYRLMVFFCKQKTAYEMRISDWSSTCALPIFAVDHLHVGVARRRQREPAVRLAAGQVDPAVRNLDPVMPELAGQVTVLRGEEFAGLLFCGDVAEPAGKRNPARAAPHPPSGHHAPGRTALRPALTKSQQPCGRQGGWSQTTSR